MKRKITDLFKTWRDAQNKMPILLQGVRQCGKTYIVQEFGKKEFRKIHTINFQKSPVVAQIFKVTKQPQKIIQSLNLFLNDHIDIEQDLLFFDEIQDCPDALTSLKFFAEDLPLMHIIAAGSLLGVYITQNSYPVGKVKNIVMHPMNFEEFLWAKKREDLASLLDVPPVEWPPLFHETMSEYLREYLVVGGMPEIVERYYLDGNIQTVRQRQLEIVGNYTSDFAKYADHKTAMNLYTLFQHIPVHLAQTRRKVVFKEIRKGSRYADFQSALEWLVGSGLVHQIPIINHAQIPLKAHLKPNQFKLYFCDVGLLGALAEVPLESFSLGQDFFTTFKGAYIENFFIQEFRSYDQRGVYCWNEGEAEVDFIWQEEGGNLMPCEVKSGASGKLKSLKVFAQKYNPTLRIRASSQAFQLQDGFLNLPLYALKLLQNLKKTINM